MVKNNRGDLGYITHERLDPTFVEAAFSTPKVRLLAQFKLFSAITSSR